MSKKLRPVISLVLLAVALGVGITYIARHHQLLKQLGRTPPLVSLAVLGLYAVMFGALVLILGASVRLCGLRLNWHENGLLNSHSLFINFFVPGQGGPAYRGLYLYKRHRLAVKHYIIVTLLYYAVYAVISVFLLLVSNRPWWQTLAGMLGVAAVSGLVIRLYSRRSKLGDHALALSRSNLSYLFVVTLLQALIQIVIYAVELHSVNHHVGFGQVVTYTGAANLALFVSLTPGAIGIRESFLIFTRHLHHISSANIIVANVIDRSVYLVFLLLLLILTIILHANGKGASPFKLD